MTVAPWRASPRVIARPMPRDPPVTSAYLPVSSTTMCARSHGDGLVGDPCLGRRGPYAAASACRERSLRAWCGSPEVNVRGRSVAARTPARRRRTGGASRGPHGGRSWSSAGPVVAPRGSAAGVPELGGFDVADVGVEGGEQAGDPGPGPGAEGDPAPGGVDELDDGATGSPAGDDVGGQVHHG